MSMWYVLVLTGECRNRFWYGPFADEDSARGYAFSQYGSHYSPVDHWPVNTRGLVEESSFFCRVFYGIGKEKPEGKRQYWFTEEPKEIIAIDKGGNSVMRDPDTFRGEVEEDTETVDYCAGPMVDDWCEDCGPVQDLAALFYVDPYNNGNFFPLGPDGVEFIEERTGPEPSLYSSVVSPLQAEIDGVCEYFDVSHDSFFSADGTNAIFAAYGFDRVARIIVPSGGFPQQYGYPNTNFGPKWYVPDSQVQAWLESGCFCLFQAFDPTGLDYQYWFPLDDIFGPDELETARHYFEGWQVRVELFAQVVTSHSGFGGQFTARTAYELGFYNQIEGFPGYQTFTFQNTLYTDFIPAGDGYLFFGKNWAGFGSGFCVLPEGFRHTNDLDGKEIGKMVGPWAIAVNCQITPLFRVANGYNDCDVLLGGETSALTVIGRCPRNAWDLPFPFAIEMPSGTVINPDDHRNYESWPFDYGQFTEVYGPPNDPIPKTTRKFVGWSGNGLPLWQLMILNPAWFINVFIDNYPPFKRVPGYKKMIEFIRYITGDKSQYAPLGVDPVTGWEYYPVPVIIGADESGFPVYGEPVYLDVPAGEENG